MDTLDFRYLTTIVFTSIFSVFGIYHLLSFLVLKHRLLLYYFILILGLTLHWSLYFFLNGAFGGEFAALADKASLTTAMITTLGLLLFTKSYLNISAEKHPLLSKIYKVTLQIVIALPVLQITNHLTAKIVWLNEFLVLMAAFMAMSSILLNIFSGIRLFRSHELNRYYLYSYAPILMAALLYIGTWFAKRYYEFDVNPILLTTSILVTFQLILFSLIIGFKYKAIEEQHMQMQINANKRLEAEVAKQTADLQVAKKVLEYQNEELEKIKQIKNKHL